MDPAIGRNYGRTANRSNTRINHLSRSEDWPEHTSAAGPRADPGGEGAP